MKNTNRNLLTVAFILFSGMLSFPSLLAQNGNVGIGTTDPNSSAILDLTSTNQGLLMPRLNQSQEDALTAPLGLVFYNTNTRTFRYQDGFGLRNIGYWSQSIFQGGEEKITYRNGEVIIQNPHSANGLTLESGRLNFLTNYDANGSDGTIKIGSDFFMDNNEIVAKGTYYINSNSAETTAGVEICGNGANTILNRNGGNVGIGTGTTSIDLAIGDSDTGLQQQGDGQLAFYTNNVERGRFNSSGNFGIGTSNPAYRLDVNGNSRIVGLQVGPNTGFSGADASLNVGVNSGNARAASFYNNDAPDGNGNSVATVRINNDGNGIALYIDEGSAVKPGGGSWSGQSDRRLKQDIKNYSEGLDQINAINTVSYRYNELAEASPDDTYIGIIAQELQEIAPHMVKQQGEYLTVDPSAFTYMLINAVQEQDQIITDQQKEIDELKARLDRIEALLEK